MLESLENKKNVYVLEKNMLESLFPGYAQKYLEQQQAAESETVEEANSFQKSKKNKPFDGGDLSSIVCASDI